MQDLMLKQGSALDRYFKISERGSNFSREIRGGFATFFAMSYIVVLNPLILSGPDSSGATLGFPAVAAVTAFVAGILTILMGAWAKHPFALATGLGVNAFVAVTVATNPGLTWPDMMGLVMLSGITMLILVLTGFRTAVFKAVPEGLKTAIVVGIGLFIALIGLVNAGFVRRIPDVAGTTVPVGLGFDGKLLGWPTLVFVFGLILTIALVVRKVKGAILIGIVASTVLSVILEFTLHIGPSFDGTTYNPQGWSLVAPAFSEWAAPDLSLIGQANPFGAFEHLGFVAATLLAFVILLSIFFDAMGTMVGLATEADSIDKDGNIPNVDRVLQVDALGAIIGGGASVSSNQIYVESGAGIGEGARTGLASDRHRPAVPRGHVLHPADQPRAVRGRGPGARHRRLHDGLPGRQDRLAGPGHRDPGLPDLHPDAVHLLDRQRPGCRLHHLRPDPHLPGPRARGAPADVGCGRGVPAVLRASARSRPRWACTNPPLLLPSAEVTFRAACLSKTWARNVTSAAFWRFVASVGADSGITDSPTAARLVFRPGLR